MVSQAELYEYLSKNEGKRFKTKELERKFNDRFVRKKLNQLYKFKMVCKKECNGERYYHFEWWGR